MTRCIIFAGGPIDDIMFYRDFDFKDSIIIAADSGMKYAKELGIHVNHAVGDFDSISIKEVVADKIHKFNSEKDDTDTMISAKLAVSLGVKEVVIIGALGGRLDHTFANLQTLKYLLDNGVTPSLLSQNEEIFLIHNDSIRFKRKEGYSLSLFCISNEAIGVNIRGAKYPLENAKMTSNIPIGVSNVIVEESAEISVEMGYILIIFSKINHQNIEFE